METIICLTGNYAQDTTTKINELIENGYTLVKFEQYIHRDTHYTLALLTNDLTKVNL